MNAPGIKYLVHCLFYNFHNLECQKIFISFYILVKANTWFNSNLAH